jgi:hypothetical protein
MKNRHQTSRIHNQSTDGGVIQMKLTATWTVLLATIGTQVLLTPAVAQSDGAEVVSFYGYDDCIRLHNNTTQVTLCPAAGGRVLQYAINGKDALYLPPGSEGWTNESGQQGGSMAAGRFDIGPEQTTPGHPGLWSGRWTGTITGARTARLVSAKDQPTGVQLIRDFVLANDSSQLACTQTIHNVSKETKEYCHWSRTFALGGGICVIPLTEPSRFPRGYVMYGPGPVINFEPDDPHIHQRDGFLEITAAPQFPKLGMDSYAGWFAYLMKNDVMFVKQFPTFPDRVYNEVAGLTMSIWYPDRPMCELEPIGPRERLAPGESASFTETWWLLPHKFPQDGMPVDLRSITSQVTQSGVIDASRESSLKHD